MELAFYSYGLWFADDLMFILLRVCAMTEVEHRGRGRFAGLGIFP